MKTMNILSILGALSVLSATATADVYYSTNAGVTGTPFGSVTDVFTGSANMTKSCFGINVNLGCTMSVEGTIADNGLPNGLDLKDLTASVSGGSSGLLKCSDIKVTIPQTASVDGLTAPVTYADTTPVPFVLPQVDVATACGSCSGPLSASFSNAGGGQFTFMGSIPGATGACQVTGTLNAAPNTYAVKVTSNP